VQIGIIENDVTVDPTDEQLEQADALRNAQPTLEPEAAFQQLLNFIRNHPDALMREAAAYGLRELDHRKFDRYRMIAPLTEVVEDKNEEPSVRGTAAESIGSALMYPDRRRKAYRQAVSTLIEALRDESPEVRFWACYSLGVMRVSAALDDLRRVAATDTAMYPGWWFVRDEAADAIGNILGEPFPFREREG
jgi:HEAT repeat protein